MTVFIIGLVLGATAASAGWWIKVRSLSGVVSDLQNASSVAKNAAAQATDTAKKL